MKILQALLGVTIISLVILIIVVFVRFPQVPPVITYQSSQPRALETSQIANAMDNLKSSVFETITASGTAKGLTVANLTHTTHGTAYAARISVDGDLRITMDGATTPTFAIGEELHDSEVNTPLMVYWPDNLSNVQFINDTDGTTATVNVHYFYLR